MSERPPSAYRPDPTMLHISIAPSTESNMQNLAMLSRSSSARNWAYTSQNHPPPPASLRPHTITSVTSPPPASTSGLPIPGAYSEEEEYMNIRASRIDFREDQLNCGNSDTASGKRRGGRFVGGFVNGLKKIPRVVRGPRHHGAPHTPIAERDTEATITGSWFLPVPPRYQPQEDLPPSPGPAPRYQTQEDPPANPLSLTNIHYVQGSEMPDHTSYTADRRASYAHIQDNTEAAFTIPPDPNSDHLPQIIGSPQPTNSLAPATDERHTIPLHMDPHRAPDYAKMGYTGTSHRTDLQSFTGTSFSRGLPALLDFFRNLYEMPWVSEHRIVDDYRPGQNLPDKGRRKLTMPPTSWYPVPSSSRHQSIDLTRSLESSIMPSPRPAAPVIPRRHHHGQGRSRHHHHHHGYHNTHRSSSSREYAAAYGSRSRIPTQRRASSRRYSIHGGSHRTSPRGSTSTNGVMYSPTVPGQPFYVVPAQPPAIYTTGPPPHGTMPGELGDSQQSTPQGQLTPPYYMLPVMPLATHGKREKGKHPMHSTPAPSASAVSGAQSP